jgi:heat shock protein 4
MLHSPRPFDLFSLPYPSSPSTGEDAQKSAYVERLDGMNAVGGPIALRVREQDDRPRAASQLRELLQGYQEKFNSPDYEHIPADKLQTAVEAVANAESFISNKLASQAEKMPYEKLSVTSEQILARREEVFNLVQPIITIPKPKAKTEDAPKAEEPKKDEEMKDAEAPAKEGEADEQMNDLD